MAAHPDGALLSAIAKAYESLGMNGVPSPGLEIQNDPGLAASKYVKIPLSCLVPFEYVDEHGTNHIVNVPQGFNTLGRLNKPTFDQWVMDGFVTSGGGVRTDGHMVYDGHQVISMVHKEHNLGQLRDFIAVNWTAVVARDDGWRRLIHGGRYGGLLFGMHTADESCEYELVANPANRAAGVDKFAELVMDDLAASFVLACASPVTWKMTNHATGGSPLNSYTKKVYDTLWSTITGTKVAEWTAGNADDNTSYVYMAVHATSKRVFFDQVGWAGGQVRRRQFIFLPQIMAIDPLASLKLRLASAPAGTAAIETVWEGLGRIRAQKMLPIMNERAALNELVTKHNQAIGAGMTAHVGASWFFKGGDTVPVSIGQSSEMLTLIGQIVAHFVHETQPGSSLDRSPVLKRLRESGQAPGEWVAAVTAFKQYIMKKADATVIGEIMKAITAPAQLDLMLTAAHTQGASGFRILSKVLAIQNDTMMGSKTAVRLTLADEAFINQHVALQDAIRGADFS